MKGWRAEKVGWTTRGHTCYKSLKITVDECHFSRRRVNLLMEYVLKNERFHSKLRYYWE